MGVGHPVNPLPDVGAADEHGLSGDAIPTTNPSFADLARARRAKIERPSGVTLGFQVRTYSIEPAEGIRASNLLAKERVRSALADEPEPCWPEVARISRASSLACCAERLAGAGAGPDGAVIWPAGESQGMRPATDPGEKWHWVNWVSSCGEISVMLLSSTMPGARCPWAINSLSHAAAFGSISL
jgi:hypothetical protein